ncbi:uracil-DNA glycosylase [Mycoplasmopsis felis]|uniref:uracil-DNA glycosylase n=1 Tax=Mycoplasmopsis felis TaxID=33923 RepID=UPI002AFE445E|nr:uracil-DNA glycosylase [Mycoplasmopsis felis]WQQ08337.1 uracil-DNA glycosylase [Mycoplasmopsis felis]
MKDSFLKILQSEGKKSYFQKIYNSLKDIETQNTEIYPHQMDIFRPFDYFQVNQTKVIILGQDPYHNGFADGLAFSTYKKQTPHSLKNIFKELLNNYPNTVIKTNSLQEWAQQGILLLNTVLTVSKGQPNSHYNFGWQSFTKEIIKEVINQNPNVIIVLLGTKALKFYKELNLNNHNSKNVLHTSHPSPFSFNKGFNGTEIFLKINQRLKELSNEEINWNLTKESKYDSFTKSFK